MIRTRRARADEAVIKQWLLEQSDRPVRAAVAPRRESAQLSR